MARGRIFLLGDGAFASLSVALEAAGYEVASGLKPPEAFAADLSLVDTDACGLEVAGQVAERGPAVLLSADASAEAAVRAMKLGAVDFLGKPVDVEKAQLLIASIAEKDLLRQEVEYLRRISGDELVSPEIIGDSPAVRSVREGLQKLGRAGVTTMLVTGESGTGKELVARHIHHLLHGGARRLAPFIGVNCAALPETLIESELFGHEKGAFTDARAEKKGVFELAAGGTILLDEIGEMAWHLQAKLLRVLEERAFRRIGGHHAIPVRASVIATTNRDLEVAIKAGEFRVDLFYRLAIFSLHIPPLRERGQDVLALSRHFLASFAAKYGREPMTEVSPEAARLLLAYPWPGNVRELRNAMERIVVLEEGVQLRPEHLPKEILFLRAEMERPSGLAGPILPADGLSLDELEKSLIVQALERTKGNKTSAAKLLGMSYDALRYQVKKLGLEEATGSAPRPPHPNPP
ncbi:MAG TPA: sigma-54 dependent transcriptional regulator [Myxococcales bacterium]|nr:sigma-54 dependent transcriptional regulator [Myxococcales bacterium]